MASDDYRPHARIRLWAAARGIYVEPRGPLPDAVVAAWVADLERITGGTPAPRTVAHEDVVRAWATSRGIPLDDASPVPPAVMGKFTREQHQLGR